MRSLLGLLEACAARGGAVLVWGILLGVAVPPLAAAASVTVTPVVVTLMTLVLLRVDAGQLGAVLRRPGLVAGLVAWLLVGAPLLVGGLLTAIAWGWGPPGPGWAGLLAGVVVFAAGCGATSSPAFARLLGLDAELTLVVALATTLLVPLTAPPIALGLLGVDLALTVGGLMGRLGLVVGLPLVGSLLLRWVLGPARLARGARAVDGATVLLVAVYGVGVMDGVQALLLARPGFALGGIGLAFLAAFGSNLVTAMVFARAGREVAWGAGLVAGNRNMALFLAVLPAAVDAELRLFLALCQFPLFFSPFLLLPVYRRLRGRPVRAASAARAPP